MDEIEKEESLELVFLDNLIENYYSKLLKNGAEKIKLGDLLKMIELKRKLAPENSEQKKFWEMLNKIRKENLQDKNQKQNSKENNE